MDNSSEKKKMINGFLYNAADPELVSDRKKARQLLKEFNNCTEKSLKKRNKILQKLLGNTGGNLQIEPPFYCDYGYNISIGRNFFGNFGIIILDCAPVIIGENVLFGPNVQVYTATHPTDPVERNSGLEFAKPIIIGKNVWIGGGAIINPGIIIGDNSTIGSGSVVTKNIEPNMIAVGNPCRVIKEINKQC